MDSKKRREVVGSVLTDDFTPVKSIMELAKEKGADLTSLEATHALQSLRTAGEAENQAHVGWRAASNAPAKPAAPKRPETGGKKRKGGEGKSSVGGRKVGRGKGKTPPKESGSKGGESASPEAGEAAA